MGDSTFVYPKGHFVLSHFFENCAVFILPILHQYCKDIFGYVFDKEANVKTIHVKY